MDKKIEDFIASHHVMTLATVDSDGPYCCNLFYAYDSSQNAFVVTSDSKTLHASQASSDSRVAASIVLETKMVGRVEGLQITGSLTPATEERFAQAKRLYLKKYPYAIAMELELWILDVKFAKLTDNKLGFGKKIIWRADV